jgi:hypothetical protein
MNKVISTTLIVLAVLVLAGTIFFAGSMYGRINGFGPSMMYGWTNNNGYGPNMMNGRGPSMMGNGGMMNGGGPVMRNGYGYNNDNLPTLTIDQAKAAAEKYLANLNNSDLKIAEIMIFDNNAYVVVKESSTGIGAFELLVDPASQAAYPEHGPNMMWNLKYSGSNHQNMMGGYGGMMGGYGNMMQGWDSSTAPDVNAPMTITSEQAIQYAQKYLDANISGATAATDPIQFYGYYTLDFEKNGKVAGMLSVNGYSGQIFLHTWHGKFVEESEIQ